MEDSNDRDAPAEMTDDAVLESSKGDGGTHPPAAEPAATETTDAKEPPEAEHDVQTTSGDGTPDMRMNHRHDALLPFTIVGGILGMLAGTLPATIWYLIFGRSFSFMYLFLPLLVYLGIKLFKGYMGRHGIVAACIFTAAGFYLTLLSCQAAAFVIQWKMLFVNVPFVTITMIGQRGVLTGAAVSSAYIFPFVFTLIGMFLAGELMLAKRAPAPAPEDANA